MRDFFLCSTHPFDFGRNFTVAMGCAASNTQKISGHEHEVPATDETLGP